MTLLLENITNSIFDILGNRFRMQLKCKNQRASQRTQRFYSETNGHPWNPGRNKIDLFIPNYTGKREGLKNKWVLHWLYVKNTSTCGKRPIGSLLSDLKPHILRMTWKEDLGPTMKLDKMTQRRLGNKWVSRSHKLALCWIDWQCYIFWIVLEEKITCLSRVLFLLKLECHLRHVKEKIMP